MSATSVWLLVGPTVHAAYRNRYAKENADPPEEYTGPMDDTSYAIMSTMQSGDAVQSQYKIKGSGAGAFIIYSTYFDTEAEAIASVTWMNDHWAKPQVIEQGGWSQQTGLQIGVEYTYDENGEVTGTTGTPLYPIPADLYEIMPDTVVYDENGDEVSRTPASSNADLRDVNLVAGQAPRIF